jgi:signal transduction histidine kinase
MSGSADERGAGSGAGAAPAWPSCRARTEAEIEESRARLVEAADGARRRLARDLHDGAQQRFVAAVLTLRRVVALTRGTPAGELVSEAFEQLELGLAELRELAQGIHPAVLGEHGLAVALEGLAARATLPVELRVTAGRVAPGVESAIYFTVAEALTNVAKHARATRAEVEVHVRDGTLFAEVADDGVGGASLGAGSGLRGLADRLDALGGDLSLERARGGGTVLRATVPLRPHLHGVPATRSVLRMRSRPTSTPEGAAR